MDEAYADLRAHIFSMGAVPEDAWGALCAAIKLRVYERGERFIQPGMPSSPFAFIRKGLVKRYFDTEEGVRMITSFDAEGTMVSDLEAILKEEPTKLSIEAIERTTLLVWEAGFHEELHARFPVWMEIGAVIAQDRFLRKAEREAMLLKRSGEARYLEFCERFPELLGRVSQKDVASYLGLTEVSLSRIVSALRLRRDAT